MKITQIDVRNLLIPLKVPYALQKSYGIKSHTCCVMVAVHTDEGIVGYGECNPQPGFTDESAETAKSVIGSILAPAIMGMDPTDVAAIDRRMDVVCKNNNLPKAAVNTACYDIAGKAAGVPVYKLLGGKLQDSIPIMHAIGNVSAEDGAKLVLQRKNEGYRSVMVKCGMESVEYDAERIFAIQEAVGKDYPLVADVNQGWDYHKALRFLRLTEGCNIVCLEQPVPHWDIDSLARLKGASDVPISADESVFSIHEAVQVIEKRAVDIISLKVNKHGGILKEKQIAVLAQYAGIKLLMNSMLEEGLAQAASLQIGVTLPNLVEFGSAYFSPLRLDDDITTYSEQVRDGWVHVSGKPGLGVEIREEVVQKYLQDEFSVKG